MSLLLEDVYRPVLVAEMRTRAASPFTAEKDRPLFARLAELFAVKPWDEVVAVYLGQFDSDVR